MDHCAFCDSPAEFEAIHHNELVKICGLCSRKEGIPIIKKPSTEQIRAMERPYSMQERMARLSGEKLKTTAEVKKVFAEKTKPQDLERLGLIDNFHWHLTRARRARGISVRQLALSLHEPEESLVQIEQGFLPGNALVILRKIEDFLKINLMKKEEKTPSVMKVFGNKDELMGKEVEIVGDDEEVKVE